MFYWYIGPKPQFQGSWNDYEFEKRIHSDLDSCVLEAIVRGPRAIVAPAGVFPYLIVRREHIEWLCDEHSHEWLLGFSRGHDDSE